MDSNNHVHTFNDTVVPATCKEIGYTLHKCECGDEHKDNFTNIANHDFKKFDEVAPTCTEAGKVTYRCEVCDKEKVDTVAPLGHDWGEWNKRST